MTFLESLNDILSEGQPVEYKNDIFSSLNIFLIALGSFFVLLSIIDMIVFYVIPNNKIKENRRKYPYYTFEKPNKGIIALHFLEHIFLLLEGIVIIFAIFPDIKKSIAYISTAIIIAALIALFYILQLVLCAIVFDSIPNDDIDIDSISILINKNPPIDSMFVYSYGKIHRSKSADQKCYSKGGINILVDSVRSSQLFITENNPSYFILKVEQNVSMTNELKDVLNQAKDIVRSCDPRYSRVVDYYPLVEKDNLIKNGRNRPKYLSKKFMLASIFLGVGVYIELYYKSLPIVEYVQNSDANVVSDFDYKKFLDEIQFSDIGKCEKENKKPHPYF